MTKVIEAFRYRANVPKIILTETNEELTGENV